jgi:small multidrug resistance family-3 protein
MIESLASNIISVAVGLFFVAALTEIGGGYLVWQWIREKKGIIFSISKAK